MAQVTHFQRQASHDDLVERARQLVPHLRQRVKEMDQLGYLPEATVQELQDAELFQLTTPRIYGGHQVDVRTFLLSARLLLTRTRRRYVRYRSD